MATPNRFLSLVPTTPSARSTSVLADDAVAAVGIVVAPKTRRSSSTTTDASVSSGPAINETVVPVEQDPQYLKLGH